MARIRELQALKHPESPAVLVSPSAAPQAPAKPVQVVCMATRPWMDRHVCPVAHAGGWPLVGAPDARVREALVVVASVADERAAMAAGAAGTVLMEHGAGLHYDDPTLPADSAWRGGRGHGRGRQLFLSPGQALARAHRRAHPGVPAAAVGAPSLDAWHPVGLKHAPAQPRRPIVCVSTHWDCRILPELRSSWSWLEPQLAALAADPRWEVWGHWHPHDEATGEAGRRRQFYAATGIRAVSSWEEVLRHASLFITDNSSTLYEFAASGRPVVALNPPWYRREVRHGLRFWDAVPGIQHSDLSGPLAGTVAAALDDAPDIRAIRERAVAAAYGRVDGKAAERAARAIRRRFRELITAP